MALQFGIALRNAQADALETAIGTAPHLYIRTGAPPADCATADAGTLLVDVTLPSDWLTAASSGQKTKSGTWSANATAGGTAGHFRIKDAAATVCHVQGTCGQGSGDMSLVNTSLASGQPFQVNTFTYTRGNA